MKLSRFFLVLVIAAVLTFPASAWSVSPEKGPYGKTIAAARESAWRAITSGEGAGASVAVMDNGKIVYSEGFGVADRAENRPVDRNTRFNIGSTSKMFAAVAVLLLVDDGKLKLEDPVIQYLPDFRMRDERYRKITVRMLFNHSSGLPGSTFYFGLGLGRDDFHRVLLDTLKDSYLKHDPGEMSIYCNDGFTLAEMIVEKISGEKYVDFLKKRVFRPLGMSQSGPSIGELKHVKAAEYYDAKTGKKYPREVVKVYGAGGLSSTPEDLCRFGDSLTGKGRRILSAASTREILKTQPTRFSGKLKGKQIISEFGWEYSNLSGYEEKGIQVLGKGGNTPSYSANLQIVPEKRIVIALTISGHVTGEKLTRPILDALMAEKRVIEVKAKGPVKPAGPQVFPPELLKYAGFYAKDKSAFKVEFDAERKGFTMKPVDAASGEKPSTFTYGDGYFHNKENQSCYFTEFEGKSYIVIHSMPFYEADMLNFQKLDPVRNPVSLGRDVAGKIWVLRNAPYYMYLDQEYLIVTSKLYKELPGYLEMAGMKKIESPDLASIAVTAWRDQAEVHFFERQGEPWVKLANFTYSSAEGLRKAASGQNRITIEKEGYNEWLKLDKGALLSFEKLLKGRVIVATPGAVLFDSIVDEGEIYAPEGSYVFCAGAPGTVFTVKAR